MYTYLNGNNHETYYLAEEVQHSYCDWNLIHHKAEGKTVKEFLGTGEMCVCVGAATRDCIVSF